LSFLMNMAEKVCNLRPYYKLTSSSYVLREIGGLNLVL